MRIDPAQIGDQLRHITGGDAARGARTAATTESVQDESRFESVDRLLLKQLAVQSAEEAATSSIAFADAEALADRTAQLIAAAPRDAHGAHGELARDRLRGLLGY